MRKSPHVPLLAILGLVALVALVAIISLTDAPLPSNDENVAGLASAKGAACADPILLRAGETVTRTSDGRTYEATAVFIGSDLDGRIALISLNGELTPALHEGQGASLSSGVVGVKAIGANGVSFCVDTKREVCGPPLKCVERARCPMAGLVQDTLRIGENRTYTIDGRGDWIVPYGYRRDATNAYGRYVVSDTLVESGVGQPARVGDRTLLTTAVGWSTTDGSGFVQFCFGN